MMVEKVRLRIVFEGHQILSKLQRKEGLKKCWILFRPRHYKTIAHLSDYLLRIFHLKRSSPHGLTLSMDGFVLPPFESTCIFKDNDIVCVRKKAAARSEIADLDNGVKALEQPALAGVKLLANEELEQESRGYESESEGYEPKKSLDKLYLENTTDVDKVCKKRKASKKLGGSKKKKTKFATAKVDPEDVENDAYQANLDNERDSSDLQGELENSTTPQIDETSKDTINAKRLCQLDENGKGSVDVSSAPGGTKKFPSRSARRKKAKRRWLREQAKKEKIEKLFLPEGNPQLSDEDDQKLSDGHLQPDPASRERDNGKLVEECQQPDPNSDADGDIVPIVIRPGHIRFAPLRKGDAVQAVAENKIPAETFQWKGVTSKKKGQKWGKEKAVSSKRNNYENFNKEYSEMLTTEEVITVNEPKDLDFDKLKPYTSIPKEGDVIAYRLIELSSSWTPEPTSYRVGKISQYDVESNRIMLLPVPEYPLDFERKIDEDASVLQSETSHLYEDDGSLQTDFSSLLDVRMVVHGNSNYSKSVTDGVDDICVGDHDAGTNLRDNIEKASTHVPPQENGIVHGRYQDAATNFRNTNTSEKPHRLPGNVKVNPWEEISQALSAKKAELSQGDDQSKKEDLGSKRWSYKALRSSALGPTMAFLRAQNGL